MSYETHAPGGKSHPQFILDYISAFKACNPDQRVPALWNKGNGWIHFQGMKSVRQSGIEAMTKVLLERIADR